MQICEICGSSSSTPRGNKKKFGAGWLLGSQNRGMSTPTWLPADTDLTDAQILALLRRAVAEVTVFGQSNLLRGNTVTRADLSQLTAAIKYYQALVSGASRGMIFNRVRRGRSP